MLSTLCFLRFSLSSYQVSDLHFVPWGVTLEQSVFVSEAMHEIQRKRMEREQDDSKKKGKQEEESVASKKRGETMTHARSRDSMLTACCSLLFSSS